MAKLPPKEIRILPRVRLRLKCPKHSTSIFSEQRGADGAQYSIYPCKGFEGSDLQWLVGFRPKDWCISQRGHSDVEIIRKCEISTEALGMTIPLTQRNILKQKNILTAPHLFL